MEHKQSWSFELKNYLYRSVDTGSAVLLLPVSCQEKINTRMFKKKKKKKRHLNKCLGEINGEKMQIVTDYYYGLIH